MQENYTTAWLLDVLEKRQIINSDIRSRIEARLAPAKQRLEKQHADTLVGERGLVAARYRVAPGELLAALELSNTSGEQLGEDALAKIVAEEIGCKYIKIDPLKLDMDLIISTLSRPFALRHCALPLSREFDSDGNETLVVAVENPYDAELKDGLQRIAEGPVRLMVSAKTDIIKSIHEVYGFRQSVDRAAQEKHGHSENTFEQLEYLRSVKDIESTDRHVVNAVDYLLRYAFDQRASDIHIEPRRKDTQVRLRIDGVLHDVQKIPRAVHPAIVARLKNMSRMDIAEKRRPQDGRIKTVMQNEEVELRLSCLPTAFGEKVVIRIFDPKTLLLELPELGFDSGELGIFNEWVSRPNGLILITGPTGSGKTTTLYTTLKLLATADVNITTIEDPIEMVWEYFNQVAVQPKIDLGFAEAMRAILRQDPDIIMVGEIRDKETATMAVQAALTGHLVFSTLHTNDTAGALSRMLDLGVAPYLLASALTGVMAQRLLRKICRQCKKPAPLTADQAHGLGIPPEKLEMFAGTMHGEGCVACRHTGYQGRIGVFELLNFDQRLRQHFLEDKSDESIRRLIKEDGMRTLESSALETLASGQTTFEEIIRVLGH